MSEELRHNIRKIVAKQDNWQSLLKKCIVSDDYFVYISLTMNCSAIIKILKQNKINIKKCYIITPFKCEKGIRSYRISKQHSFSEIAMLAKDLVDALPGKKSIVIDSVKDLINATDTSETEDFLDFLLRMSYRENVGLIIFSEPKVLNLIPAIKKLGIIKKQKERIK